MHRRAVAVACVTALAASGCVIAGTVAGVELARASESPSGDAPLSPVVAGITGGVIGLLLDIVIIRSLKGTGAISIMPKL